MKNKILFTVLILLITFPLTVFSENKEKKSYSPYVGESYPKNVYWGDTHLHTGLSMDAGAFGARLSPEDAYRFARGEELTSSVSRMKVKLSRPLDFLVVADHSDNMGFFPKLYAGDPEYLKDETGKIWYDKIQQGGDQAVEVALEIIDRFSKDTFPPALESKPGTFVYRDAWEQTINAADKYNDPGKFTAFIGYEWTSNTGGNNLHRVLVYKDDGKKAIQMEPYTTIRPEGSDNPRDLWKWLDTYETKTGGKILAIAHNGNLSNGIMFPIVDSFSGKKIDRKYFETRIRWEPLYEVTQIKGDGEAHPFLSPDDEFADYETWDKGNLNLSVPKKPEMLQNEYARAALKTGLKLDKELGVNPYKFGMIGSTDSHTGLTTADEDNFFGKHSGTEPNPERMTHLVAQFGDEIVVGWEQAASGYAAVWATENTREALFDAMQSKETYATTGPRIQVRFFGGWDYTSDDINSPNYVRIGYKKGVPMGGDLTKAPKGKSPVFLIHAAKDPEGANLDRVQVIKGWLDKDDTLKEKIYNVALSDNRKTGKDGKAPSVGNTVDVQNATYKNSIGDYELAAIWADPDFNPKERSFYYVRVLEIPTPRWTTYDAAFFGVEIPEGVPTSQQERAYTSPIWYTP